VWNLSTLTQLPEPDGPADDWVFSKDGLWLASKDRKGGLEIWNLSAPQPLRTHLDLSCDAFEFSSDSAFLLTGLEDKPGSLLDLRTMNARILPMVFGQARAFSSRTHQLANANGTTIQLVDTGSNQIEVLQGHTKPIADLEFSEDGSILASVDTNGSVILWDPRGRRRISDTLIGPGNAEDSDYHLAFDASDKSFKLGDVSIPAHPDRWVQDLCSRFETTLSESEWRAMAGHAPYPWRCDSVKGITGNTLAQFRGAR
jgi:WD40 repeat protein